MADNSSIPVASGNETFGNKDIGGVKYPQHILVDSTGAEVVPATSAKQDTGNTSLATIATNTTDAATETTLVALSAKIPASPATTGGQDTGNTSLAAINTALGAKTDAASTATDTTSVSAISIWKQISASVQAIATSIAGTLTVATHAVTQSGAWVLSAGSALIGKVMVSDGVNDAKVRAGSSSADVTDNALVAVLRPDSLDDIFGAYETVAASQTDQALGATGATGDYLAGFYIQPAVAACGTVVLKDGATTIYTFPGGGTTELPTLAPIPVQVGIYSTNGAWSFTTGADVSVLAIGKFT